MKMNPIQKLTAALSLAVALTCSSAALAQTAAVSTTVSTTETAGTISEFSPDTIVVRSETAPAPIRYSYSKTTTYVDDTGAPVSIETVKSGLPVTVFYTREGDRMIANKVVVRKSTTTTAKPVVEEKRSTTTTTTTDRK
jgi:hypothetical protein